MKNHMGAWRDELVAQAALVDERRVSIAALLVAATEQLVADAAAACAQLPQIEGLEYQEVAPGVIRAAVSSSSSTAGATTDQQVAAGAFALDDLRKRLDAKSIATAVEWTAPTPRPNGSLGPGGRVSDSEVLRPPEFRLSGAVRASSAPAVVLAEVSDEELAREMLRRATSRGLGRAEGGGTI